MPKGVNIYFQYLALFFIFAVLAFSVFNDGGIDIISHLLISASLFVFGVLYFLRNSKKAVSKRKLKVGYDSLFLLLFILFFLCSYFLSETKNVGLFEMILFVSAVFLYIFVSSQKWRLKALDNLLLGVLMIAFSTALLGYFDYFFEPFNRFSSSFGIGIYKFVSYPNAYATFILAVLPVNFYFIFKKSNRYLNAFFIFSAIVLLNSLLLTYSRGALVVLIFVSILSFAIYAFTRPKANELIKKIVLVFGVVLVAGLLTYPVNQIRASNNLDVNTFTEKVTFESDEQIVSATNRLDFWKGSVSIFLDNPCFGTGPGSFEYVFPAYQKSFLGNSNSPHNFFLKILSENGIFAGISIILFFVFILVRFLKVVNIVPDKEKFLLLTLALSVVGNLSHNMLDYNLNFVSNILLLFVFMGFAGGIINKYSGHDLKEQYIKALKISFLVIGAMMFYLSVHEAYYSFVFKKARALHDESLYTSAEEYYQKSENIFLKRGLYIVWAQMHHEIYEENNKHGELEKAEKLLLKAASLNERDAFLYNYLGDIYLEKGNKEKASKYYNRALLLDPKNNLDYYHDVLKTDDNLNKKKVEAILKLLDDYLIQLKNNAHLTVLTNNPDSAVEIYELLEKKIINSDIDKNYLDEISKAKAKMKNAYSAEINKFEQYYDLKLEKNKD